MSTLTIAGPGLHRAPRRPAPTARRMPPPSGASTARRQADGARVRRASARAGGDRLLAPRRRPVRLTARGRVVVLMLVVAFAVAAVALVGAPGHAGADGHARATGYAGIDGDAGASGAAGTNGQASASSYAGTNGHAGAPGAVAQRVTVERGDTLWAIARAAVPGADPRTTIARIKEMNGLTSSDIAAGRVLLVPRG